MHEPFSFKQSYLLPVMGTVLLVSAAVAYQFNAWRAVLFAGFIFLMVGGAAPKIRAGAWWSISYPPPNRIEGAIAAVGLSAMFGALVVLVTPKVLRWLA